MIARGPARRGRAVSWWRTTLTWYDRYYVGAVLVLVLMGLVLFAFLRWQRAL